MDEGKAYGFDNALGLEVNIGFILQTLKLTIIWDDTAEW